jgi:hypothetical protein
MILLEPYERTRLETCDPLAGQRGAMHTCPGGATEDPPRAELRTILAPNNPYCSFNRVLPISSRLLDP